MRELTIGKNDAGQRVDRFVSKALPLLPPALLQKYIRLKRIKVNGGRAQRDQRLQEGDVLQLYINDEFFDKPREDNLFLTLFRPSLDIVYEDENLAVLYKPAHLLCHSDRTGDANLVDAFTAYLTQKGEYIAGQEHTFAPALCNRLDRGTEGLVLAAKTYPALRDMNEIIREDLVSISGFPYHGEVDVLETATVKDRMFVLYRLEQNGTFERQGIYQFQRGLFGGYRFRSREYDTCPIVNTSLIQIGRQRYLEIYTANWPKEAASFRVFPGYRPPAYDGEEEILPDISTLAPVYEGTAAKSILQVIPVTEEQVKAGFFGSMSVAYYDAEGSQLDTGELIKLYRNSEGGSGGGGGGNGAIWPVDVFQVILVILGIIMTRYFLCPEPKKERKDHL